MISCWRCQYSAIWVFVVTPYVFERKHITNVETDEYLRGTQTVGDLSHITFSHSTPTKHIYLRETGCYRKPNPYNTIYRNIQQSHPSPTKLELLTRPIVHDRAMFHIWLVGLRARLLDCFCYKPMSWCITPFQKCVCFVFTSGWVSKWSFAKQRIHPYRGNYVSSYSFDQL